jgi:hypothetical protein
MAVITPEFVEHIIGSGSLTEAASRLKAGTAHPINLPEWGTWSLICEEILDTDDDDHWYDSIVAELVRRGFDYDQIDAMRRFAWKTAGWLNFDKALWEWGHLDEKAMRTALDSQLRDKLIKQDEYNEGLTIIEDPRLASKPH